MTPHPYAQEYAARNAYTERSREYLSVVLAHNTDMHKALGDLAFQLADHARDCYVPEVTQGGLVRIPDSRRYNDALPLLALRDNERVKLDTSFASFTPWQYATVSSVETRRLDMIASRAASGEREPFITQPFRGDAVTMHMMYTLAGFPTQSDLTYFNLRPLILLHYNPKLVRVQASTLVNALVQANQVLTHPVTTVEGEAELQALHAQWESLGYAAANLTQQIMGSSD